MKEWKREKGSVCEEEFARVVLRVEEEARMSCPTRARSHGARPPRLIDLIIIIMIIIIIMVIIIVIIAK